MPPRWIKTKDQQPSPFPPKDADDWVLLSGQFVAGRVFRETSGPNADRVVWTLIGLHGLAAAKGIADSLESGKAEVLAGWRQWQAWAGVRDAD